MRTVPSTCGWVVVVYLLEFMSAYNSLPAFLPPEVLEDDIILTEEQKKHLLETNSTDIDELRGDFGILHDSHALKSTLWPDKTLIYDFQEGEFSVEQKSRIIAAMSDLEKFSCVKFLPRTVQDTYILFRNPGMGCAAAVGYAPIGQGIDLFLGGQNCQTIGTIQHEILHALGLWHEHTRPDRDDFITVAWTNIYPGREFNFLRRSADEMSVLDLPYDYGSVMHYRPLAFSKDGFSATIIPKMAGVLSKMGQRIRFTNVDLAKLNELYECPSPPYYRPTAESFEKSTVGKIWDS